MQLCMAWQQREQIGLPCRFGQFFGSLHMPKRTLHMHDGAMEDNLSAEAARAARLLQMDSSASQQPRCHRTTCSLIDPT